MTTLRPCNHDDPSLLSERVAEHLRARIVQGDLGPGQRLPGERQLAEALGVSRVSVRSALQCLKAEGFLESKQGRGTQVVSSAKSMGSPLLALVRGNPESLAELIELRSILESWAAKRAATRATPEDLAELERIVLAMESDKNRQHTAKDDILFHMTIAKASGSAAYRHVVDVIHQVIEDMVSHLRLTVFDNPKSAKELAQQHREIFTAIRDGQAHRSADLMERHLRSALREESALREDRGDA
jgi:GntR family transcriptional repressor for pyruvate dehydrogenase complex